MQVLGIVGLYDEPRQAPQKPRTRRASQLRGIPYDPVTTIQVTLGLDAVVAHEILHRVLVDLPLDGLEWLLGDVVVYEHSIRYRDFTLGVT